MGNFCAELKDLLSLGRDEVGLGTVRDDFGRPSGRRRGDF